MSNKMSRLLQYVSKASFRSEVDRLYVIDNVKKLESENAMLKAEIKADNMFLNRMGAEITAFVIRNSKL